MSQNFEELFGLGIAIYLVGYILFIGIKYKQFQRGRGSRYVSKNESASFYYFKIILCIIILTLLIYRFLSLILN